MSSVQTITSFGELQKRYIFCEQVYNNTASAGLTLKTPGKVFIDPSNVSSTATHIKSNCTIDGTLYVNGQLIGSGGGGDSVVGVSYSNDGDESGVWLKGVGGNTANGNIKFRYNAAADSVYLQKRVDGSWTTLHTFGMA
jgi:hypothetical protein